MTNKLIIGCFAMCMVALAACTKTHTIPDRFSPVPTGMANIKFLNMSPGAPQVNFFVNSNKFSAGNPTSGGAVTGISYPGFYPSAVGYAMTPAGSIKVDVIVPESSTVMPNATVLTTTQTVDANKFYTLVMLDTITQAKAIMVQDDASLPDATMSYIRVANFLADSTIKAVVTKTSTGDPFVKTYASVGARTVLPFDALAASNGEVYKIDFRRTSNDALVGTITNFAPSQTKKYTVYIRGAKGIGGTGLYVNF